MKSSFLSALTIALVCCLSLTAFAQTDQQQPTQEQGEHHAMGHGGPPNPDQELAHMTQTLNLTADQQAKIKPILEDSSKQMQSLRSDASMSQQDRKTKMQEIHKSSMSQIRAVLTPDQQQKMDSMMKSHQGHHERGDQAQPAAPPQ